MDSILTGKKNEVLVPKPGEFFVVSSQTTLPSGQAQSTAVNRLHKKIRDSQEVDGMIA
jgi:hypothetical protein